MLNVDGNTGSGSQDHGVVSARERRANHHVRLLFEEAYLIALPFVDPKQGWGGRPMVRHAYAVLHETFPALTSQDVALLVPALARVFRERNKGR